MTSCFMRLDNPDMLNVRIMKDSIYHQFIEGAIEKYQFLFDKVKRQTILVFKLFGNNEIYRLSMNGDFAYSLLEDISETEQFFKTVNFWGTNINIARKYKKKLDIQIDSNEGYIYIKDLTKNDGAFFKLYGSLEV